ncbi:MAG: hypothetical protein DWQ31_02270 [Planctomycetota bacterium]|nr:MAG: hypothetical protein DWQ31_02270 [Planctomycetota bacterium]REJ95363.1 MAG: hypothetical protein DWQ35_06445 [Planctomycetota bacterium]
MSQSEGDFFVSLYMPTHRTGREQRQDPLRLKNLLRRAEEKLLTMGLSSRESQVLLKPVRAIRNDEDLWRNMSDGLAIFCTKGLIRLYRLPMRLEEEVVVNRRRFYLKPLLPMLQSNGRYFILALDQEKATLYEATRFSIREIPLPEISQTAIDDQDQTLQYHSHRVPAMGKGSTSEAVFHGHGGAEDRKKDDVDRFFRVVDSAVRSVLRNEQAPMVLACVGYLAPIYASANSYPQLIQGKVPGSPDRWAPDELRDRAWHFVEPKFQKDLDKALERLERARGTDLVLDDLNVLISAANEGRIDTLFVAEDRQEWGSFDDGRPATHVAQNGNSGEVELLDYLATETLLNSGSVFAMPAESLPSADQPAAALLRYLSPTDQ